MTTFSGIHRESWLLSMPDDCDCDRDPPENHGERMVWDFAELARTIEAAMSDPELRRQIEANRDRLLVACETALAIETALDATVLSAAE